MDVLNTLGLFIGSLISNTLGVPEGGLQLLLHAADDLREGRAHLGVELPAETHELESKGTQTDRHRRRDSQSSVMLDMMTYER